MTLKIQKSPKHHHISSAFGSRLCSTEVRICRKHVIRKHIGLSQNFLKCRPIGWPLNARHAAVQCQLKIHPLLYFSYAWGPHKNFLYLKQFQIEATDACARKLMNQMMDHLGQPQQIACSQHKSRRCHVSSHCLKRKKLTSAEKDKQMEERPQVAFVEKDGLVHRHERGSRSFIFTSTFRSSLRK